MAKSVITNRLQLFWGVALVLAGMGVFYRIPQVMPKIAALNQMQGSLWLIRISFYIIGIILFGGGLLKLVHHFKPKAFQSSDDNSNDGPMMR